MLEDWTHDEDEIPPDRWVGPEAVKVMGKVLLWAGRLGHEAEIYRENWYGKQEPGISIRLPDGTLIEIQFVLGAVMALKVMVIYDKDTWDRWEVLSCGTVRYTGTREAIRPPWED